MQTRHAFQVKETPLKIKIQVKIYKKYIVIYKVKTKNTSLY